MYKAVFFDWDDTLWDFRANALEALRSVYTLHCMERWFRSFDHFLSIYVERNRRLWEEYAMGLITKDYLRVERFRYPLVQVGAPVTDALALQIDTDFLSVTSSKTRLLPHAEALLRQLHKKLPIVIISNGFTQVQYGKIDRSGLRPYLSHIVLSEEVGVNKPSPLIFEHALRLVGLDAKDVLMVGDGYMSDIQGAKNASLDQFYLTAHPADGQTATYISPTLLDVAPLCGVTLPPE